MTETEWLTCCDSKRMIDFLVGAGQGNVWVETGRSRPSDRKLGLFAEACCEFFGAESIRLVLRHDVAKWAAEWCQDIPGTSSGMIPQAIKATLLRDIVGNPWNPVDIGTPVAVLPGGLESKNRKWPRWYNSTVVAIAKAIYDDRRFGDMPILADAIEEAGCANATIIDHCRGPGLHVRGCFAVDAILGLE